MSYIVELLVSTLTPTNIPASKKIVDSAAYSMYFQKIFIVFNSSIDMYVLPNIERNKPRDTNAIIPDTSKPKSTFSAIK